MVKAQRKVIGGSKPRHLAGPDRVEQLIWNAIRARNALGKLFTRADIEFDSKQAPSAVKCYFERLVAAGFLKGARRLPKSQHSPHFTWQDYLLFRDVGQQAPRLKRDGTPATGGSVRERIWQTVRILKGFSALDVQLAIEAGGAKASYESVKSYVLKLAQAGYFVSSTRGKSGPGRNGTQYRLVPSMNSGPRPPVWSKTGSVYDPNLNRIVWQRKN